MGQRRTAPGHFLPAEVHVRYNKAEGFCSVLIVRLRPCTAVRHLRLGRIVVVLGGPLVSPAAWVHFPGACLARVWRTFVPSCSTPDLPWPSTRATDSTYFKLARKVGFRLCLSPQRHIQRKPSARLKRSWLTRPIFTFI